MQSTPPAAGPPPPTGPPPAHEEATNQAVSASVYPRGSRSSTHPDIVDVQAIGVPDRKYREQIMAWVQLRDGAVLTRDDVAALCEGRIAHFKVPWYAHVTDAFPMTVTGKVQK